MTKRFTLLVTISIFFISNLVMAASQPEITVYKSPTCGCCKKWVTHLEKNGFKVTSNDVENVVPFKVKYKLPPKLSSCHTGIINGYVIEGHIPAKDILKLLNEKSATIKGIAAPGMPMGSPGMEMGDKKPPYNVLSYDASGNTKVFSRN